MKKRFLLTSVLMLLLTVMALSTATYAWFSMSMENKVNDVTVTAVSSAGGLEISTDGSAWSSSSVTIANPSLKALDVTTNEGIEFYKGGDNDRADKELTKATAGQDYFEYKLYFKTTSAGDVKLNLADSYILPTAYMDKKDAAIAAAKAPSSTVTPADSFITSALAAETADGATITNKTSYGDFSRDWIAAATRISFQLSGIQTDTVANFQSANVDNLVGPADNRKPLASQPAAVAFDSLRAINLGYSSIDGTYSISKNTNTNIAAEVTKAVKPATTNYVLDSADNTYNTSLKELFASNEQVTIFSIKQNADTTKEVNWVEGKTMIAEVTVRVWIEGQDKDAKLPLTAGQFTSALSFTLVPGTVKYDGTKYVALSSFVGQKAGFNWAPLTDTAAFTGTPAIYKGTIESNADLTTAEKLVDVDITKGNKVLDTECEAGTYTLVVELATTAGPTNDGKLYPTGFLYAPAAGQLSFSDNAETPTHRYIYLTCEVK